MKDAKQAQMADVALFRDCTPKDLAWIAGIGDALDVGASSTLTLDGAGAREFIVVIDGVASDGDVVSGPGSYFGGVELLDGRPYASTVEAATDMRLLVFGPREFRALLARVPSVARALMRDLTARLRDQDELSLRAVS